MKLLSSEAKKTAAAAITWLTYYRAKSLEALCHKTEAANLLRQMRDFAQNQMDAPVKIDYFATSLPNLLLFEDDIQKRNQEDCLFVLALSELGCWRSVNLAWEISSEL